MSRRQPQQKVSTLKYIQNSLSLIQYNSFTEIFGKNSALIFPYTLKHFHHINHLSNTTKRLENEIDGMIKQAQKQNTQLQPTLIKQRLSFLLSTQQEKINHAFAALQELRWQRNALGMRLLLEQQPVNRMVSSQLFQVGEDDSNELPFERSDLLLNARYASCSGVHGNRSVLPVDTTYASQVAQLLSQSAPAGTMTLLVEGINFQKFKDQRNAILTSQPSQEFNYDQVETVLSAFAEITSELKDELNRFPPFKPKNLQNCDHRQALNEMQQQLEIAAKRAQEILEKEHKTNEIQAFIGEFLQYATFPCFQENYDEESDLSMLSSTISTPNVAEQAHIEDEVFGTLEPSEAKQPDLQEIPQHDVYCYCKNNTDDETMVQCENGEKCMFASDGWFHPNCLGLKADQIGDDLKFYCPGCWYYLYKDIKTYGEGFKCGKRKQTEIRKFAIGKWKTLWNIDLTKK
ncbi:hypothetical protein SS50377_20050 [Spironucleus salmonicida]|uniref:Uncharacterized protein n=1 Tax=Spironucleus salmonicida TaxID=348837 RepID=V6M029_9EUKA|nr:hypothetical protein SS50377_20050 [Spironucleus salmonicida]|eukprot:EST49381.1 hypothetical protein SS50377_10306 [Spironucleus salmonicida]